MATFDLDPAEGAHAASKLSNDELQFLQHVVAVELAIRMDRGEYERQFHRIAEHREEMEEMVADWRSQRDRMVFAASVTADLDRLPVSDRG